MTAQGKYFNLKEKDRPELISVPPPSSNRPLLFVGGVALVAIVAFIAPMLMRANQGRTPVVTASQAPIETPRHTPPPTSDIYTTRAEIPRTELNPEILDDVLDAYDKESKQVEELEKIELEPLMHVLHYIASHTEKEIQDNRTDLQNNIHRYISFEDMMTRPRLVRGATVMIEGKIKLFGYTEYDPAFQLKSGIQGIWYGNLFDRKNNQYAFRLLEGGDKFKVNDVVYLYGVFLKRMWFRNEMGMREGKVKYSIMPLIYARTAHIDDRPYGKFPLRETIIFLAVGVILILAFSIAIFREMMPSPFRKRKQKAEKQETVDSQPDSIASSTTEETKPTTSPEDGNS